MKKIVLIVSLAIEKNDKKNGVHFVTPSPATTDLEKSKQKQKICVGGGINLIQILE